MKSKEDGLSYKRGNNLKIAIHKHFASIEDFADLAELQVSSIYNYVCGRRLISLKTALILENKTNIRSEYLLNGTGEILMNNSLKTPYSVLTVAGLEQKIIRGEEIELLSYLTTGMDKPAVIMVASPEFAQKYNIPIGTLLLYNNSNSINNNILLIYTFGEYCLVKSSEGKFIDIATKKAIEKYKIIGTISYKIERFC